MAAGEAVHQPPVPACSLLRQKNSGDGTPKAEGIGPNALKDERPRAARYSNTRCAAKLYVH